MDDPIRASRTGVLVPVTKGATMRGTIATESARSKVQWYDPCALWASGIGTGSLTVPAIVSEMLDIAALQGKERESTGTGGEDLGGTGVAEEKWSDYKVRYTAEERWSRGSNYRW